MLGNRVTGVPNFKESDYTTEVVPHGTWHSQNDLSQNDLSLHLFKSFLF
jgi:hypothetical protein